MKWDKLFMCAQCGDFWVPLQIGPTGIDERQMLHTLVADPDGMIYEVKTQLEGTVFDV